MTKTFEEELNILIKDSIVPSGTAEEYMERRNDFIKKYAPQPLPEVPEFVGGYIEAAKEDCWTLLSAMDNPALSSKFRDWLKGGNFSNQEIFAQAWINGYTVQKPKRFYLKNKLTTSYLVLEKATGYYSHFTKSNAESVYGEHYQSKFTQEEIDSMQTGSYEKIEVIQDGI